MQDEQYAGLTERRNIHRQLLDEVSEIVEACDAGDYRSTKSATLREWLLQAIIGDMLAAIAKPGLRRWGLERT